MIDLKKYIHLLETRVIVTCIDGQVIQGVWSDCLDAEDAGEEERQEDSILIEKSEDELVEIYVSEIVQIEKTQE